MILKKIIITLLLIFPILLQAQVNENGYNVFYHDNGKKSSEGTMRKGKPDGYWKTYYENGQIKSEGNRKDFMLDSLWIFYQPDGAKYLEINYKENKKTGYTYKYEEGVLVSKELYEDDLKQGFSEYYYDTGELHLKVNYQDNRKEGVAYEFDKDGIVISIMENKMGYLSKKEKINRKNKDGEKHGIWKTFFELGKIHTEGRYVNDLKNGYFKEYNEKGELISTRKFIRGVEVEDAEELTILDEKKKYYPNGKVKFSGTYRNNIPEGVHRNYDEEGNISSSKLYQNGVLLGEGILDESGLKQGFWKEYYPDGTPKSEGEYRDSKRFGEWKFFHRNGQMEQTGKYLAGEKPHGKWTWYYESGKILREENYRRGLRDGDMIEYSDSNTVITKGEYMDGEKEGIWIYEMGTHKEEGKFVAGRREGEWKYHYTDGTLYFEGEFVDGTPNGRHKVYWPNGKSKKDGSYVMGTKEGAWKSYNENGVLILTIYYKDGQEIKYDGTKLDKE